jgi:hypothetical protein
MKDEQALAEKEALVVSKDERKRVWGNGFIEIISILTSQNWSIFQDAPF